MADVDIFGIAKEHDGTDPGSVAEDAKIAPRANRQGILYANPGSPYFFYTSASYSAAQTAATLAAGVASISNVVTDLLLGADTTGTMTLFFETTTAQIARVHVPSGGSNFNINLRNGPKGTAGTTLGAILVTTSMTTSSVAVGGYRTP